MQMDCGTLAAPGLISAFLLSDLCRGQMMPHFCSTGTTAGIPSPPQPTSCTPGWWVVGGGGLPRTSQRSSQQQRVLTSADCVAGWSRSPSPVFLSSRSTISPPERHCRCGRLPAAPAPSPSRTPQVCSGGVTAVQQRMIIREMSHKSTPQPPVDPQLLTAAPERLPRHCMPPSGADGGSVVDAAEQV